MDPVESSPVAPVNERVYVAVGSNVDESKLTLQWALQNFGGDFRIIHVHSPSPSSEGPGPRSRTTKGDGHDISSMQEVLDEYVRICRLAKVSVERRWIEMRDIGKGIVELVEQHAVTKLVMGAGADKHYTEGMTELISSKAKFVEQHAHPSCYIWFVCNGHLIHVREGDLSTVDMDVAFPWLPAKSAVQTMQSSPRSTLGLANFPSCSSDIEDELPLVRYERGEGSGNMASSIASDSYEDRQLALFQEENVNDEVYEQLEKAMAEAANAKREAYEELIRRQKAEKNFIDANRRVKMIDKLYSDETRRRKELEDILAKERESFETLKSQQFEECSATNDVRTSLESQLASHNHENRELRDKLASTEELLEVCNKELEETREHLENALKVNEELLTNQSGGESSTTQRHSLMEFSFSEIQEATENFDPSLKLEEGEYGSLYKGILRHTPVTIKMLHPDSSEGPSQYHREVEVVSKLRHPHLIALLGVCPEAWALIYEHPPNGSLEDCLGSGSNSTPLSWQNRIRISTEICSALIFLHSSGSDGVVHGNLIPKNILLDAQSVSKLKDIRIQDQDPSETSDVYSFGTILLQLLTGRSTPNLVTELQDALMGDINDMLDSTAGDWPFLEATQLAHLALSCCEVDRNIRPDLSSEVWEVLKSIRACCEVATIPTSQTVQNGTTEPPQYFLCPISYDIMEDPRVAADGFTYEASEIREWLNSGHDTSPMTNLQLESGRLVPNLTLKTAIQEWLQNHPQHIQRSVSNS